MSAFTAAIVGLGAASAGMSIAGGYSQARDARRVGEANAQIYEQQAGMIQEQKRIEADQYNRAIDRTKGTITARTAKGGFWMSGSPAAVMIDTETQMLMDKAIGQYNLDVQKNYAQSGANMSRWQGNAQARAAIFSGYTNAFTTMLSTAATAGMSSMTPRMPASTGSLNLNGMPRTSSLIFAGAA